MFPCLKDIGVFSILLEELWVFPDLLYRFWLPRGKNFCSRSGLKEIASKTISSKKKDKHRKRDSFDQYKLIFLV